MRQQAADPIHRLDNVGARRPEDDHHHRGLAVHQAFGAHVLHRIHHVAQIFELHRRPVAEGDDQVPIRRGFEQLIVGPDLPAGGCIRQLSLGAVGIGAGQHTAHIFQTDAVLVHHRGVQLHPDRGQRAAPHEDRADSIHLGELLRQNGGAGVVHLGPVGRVGGQGQDQDRGVGRIDLAIGREAGQIGGQITLRRVDGGLDVPGGPVDVAAQVELQRDPGRAPVTGRGHLGDPGDASELALQGRGHRGRHGLGLRPGQTGRLTEMVGKSTCGRGETGKNRKARMPARARPTVSNVVATGRLMKGAEMFMPVP